VRYIRVDEDEYEEEEEEEELEEDPVPKFHGRRRGRR
jgi:hypothetical protein